MFGAYERVDNYMWYENDGNKQFIWINNTAQGYLSYSNALDAVTIFCKTWEYVIPKQATLRKKNLSGTAILVRNACWKQNNDHVIVYVTLWRWHPQSRFQHSYGTIFIIAL
jgi:hypothetical protein